MGGVKRWVVTVADNSYNRRWVYDDEEAAREVARRAEEFGFASEIKQTESLRPTRQRLKTR